MILRAALLILGALLAATTIQNPRRAALADRRHYCGIDGPPLRSTLDPPPSGGVQRGVSRR